MTLTNFNEFKSNFTSHGFSLANLYDVKIDLPASSKLSDTLRGTFRLADGSSGMDSALDLMKLYTTECTMPGVNMSTSEYRITNTPQLKYAYGAVFSEFSITFILDSTSLIRKVFDVWTDMIYPYSRHTKTSFVLSSPRNVLRTRYKDDYVSDITVYKYERSNSSRINLRKLENNPKASRMLEKDIIPGKVGGSEEDDATTGFFKSLPVHAIKMINAFPSTISSTQLSNESSSMTQITVGFEYESIVPSSTARDDTDKSSNAQDKSSLVFK